jgi:hypothetical protein
VINQSAQTGIVAVLQRQIETTLEMLQRVIAECPAGTWTTDEPSLAIWQHAYHSLLGLSIWLRWPAPAIVLPAFHREGVDLQIGASPAYAREIVEDYRQEVFQKVRSYFTLLTTENLTEELILRGIRFTRIDLILGQIRHVQHHVGCMHSQLRRRTGSAPAWIGYGDSE